MFAAGCAAPGGGGSPAEAVTQGDARGSDAPARGPSTDSPADAPGAFPTPGALDAISDAPEPVEIFSLDVHPVQEWKLEGPFPDRIGALPAQDPSAWGQLLGAAAQQRAGLVLPTEAMNCVAREFGRFYLAYRGQPSQGLKRFITARCHASVTRVGTAWVSQDVPPGFDEKRVFERWQGSVRETLERHLGGGPRTAGIWYGRRDDHVVVMVAYGFRDVQVTPFDPFVEDGRVEVRGEVLGNAAQVTARINRGKFGVADCERVGDLAPPRFHFACRVDPDDRSTYLSVDSQQVGRLIGSPGILAMVWPGSSTNETYRRPEYGEPWPVVQASEMAEGLVALLNRIRKRSGIGPLELDAEQSEVANELAPHFFASMFGHEPESQMDLIVLGLMAGWQVNGLVESGNFAAAWTMRSNDLNDLLAESLEFPSGRQALLDPNAERLAVGSLLETKRGRESMAAVFASYTLFTTEANDAMARQVFEQLVKERHARERRAPERLEEVTVLCQAAAMRVQAGAEPRDAMGTLIQESARVLQRPVSGWVAEFSDVEEIEFPEDYLEDPSLGVAVGIGYRKPEGEPWGRWVVLLVVAAPESRGA